LCISANSSFSNITIPLFNYYILNIRQKVYNKKLFSDYFL
jgi:hypothetical protein